MDIKVEPISKILVDKNDIMHYNKRVVMEEQILVPTDSFFSIGYDEHGKERTLYRDWETDRKSTRLNSSHSAKSRMPSSA